MSSWKTQEVKYFIRTLFSEEIKVLPGRREGGLGIA